MNLGTQQALRLWRHALTGSVRRQTPDLSARQMAILMTVFLEPPPHTVRGLAAQLNIVKPAVTRALDTLSRHGLVKRQRDQADRRNIFVQRTLLGAKFLNDFSDLIIEAGKEE
ncbi:MAG: MarR family transcriptional regulator [Sphingomonadales bacterium]